METTTATQHQPAPQDWDLGLSARQDAEVREVLAGWQTQRERLARVQMRQAARAGGERRFLTASDGFGGEVKMMVHPVSYHYWGQRCGYACWSDAGFVREYLRDNPEARVRSRADHLSLVVSGLAAGAASARRFVKTYSNN